MCVMRNPVLKYDILCNSRMHRASSIYSYINGVLFNGLLAELLIILDSFSSVPEVIIWGGWSGVGKATKW